MVRVLDGASGRVLVRAVSLEDLLPLPVNQRDYDAAEQDLLRTGKTCVGNGAFTLETLGELRTDSSLSWDAVDPHRVPPPAAEL